MITLTYMPPDCGAVDDLGGSNIPPNIFFTASSPDVIVNSRNGAVSTNCGSTTTSFLIQIASGAADQDVTLTGAECDFNPVCGSSQTFMLHIGSDGSENLGACDCEAVTGAPINATNGNTWISQEDYSIPGLGGGTKIRRTWNSLWPTTIVPSLNGIFGHSWRSNLDEQIELLGPGVAKYIRADGSSFVFSHDAATGIYTLTSPPDAHTSLVFDSTLNRYTITFADGTGRKFDQSGLLIGTFDRNGNGFSVTRDASNRIATLTDAGGRQLTFSYADPNSSTLVTAIQDSTGVVATYTYGSSGQLLNVSYPDNSGITYSYDPNLLITSVTDAQAKIIETHTYDSARRGLTSARAGGVDQVTLSYGTGTAHLTDSNANATDYTYQTIGRKNFVTSVNGPRCSSCGSAGTATFSYDNSGNRTATTDALLRTVNHTYDANANLLSISQSVAGVNVSSQFTYNSFGEVLTATDPLGHVATNTYDANGNLLTTTTPSPNGKLAGSKTTFAYDAKGEITQITDPLGHITKYTYTPAGLVSSVTDALLHVTNFSYDARGNRISTTDALNGQTTFQYDPRNRLTKIIKPDLSTLNYAYDSRGRRISVTDENNKVTQFAYDDADRLLSVTDPATGVTQYAYDTENNVTSITDALLRTTRFSYDSLRRPTQTTFPSTKSELYAYDAVGNMTSKTDRKAQTVNFTYDELNRLTKKTYPDTITAVFTYDSANRLTKAQDATGTYTLTYDNMDRLITSAAVYTSLPATTFTISYSYDAGSNLTGLTDPNKGSITYTYDVLDRLTTLKDFNRNSFTYGYDVLSRMTNLTRPNAVNSTYQYDSVSNLLSVLHQKGTATIDGAAYTVDAAANRITKANKLNNAVSNYAYDSLYQLTGVTQGASATETYTYDAVGNRLSSIPAGAYSYNTSNELLSAGSASYTYDDNGNTLTKTDGTGSTSYSWDFENRIVSVRLPSGSTTTFKYDPFGRRIQKNTSLYVYDGSNLIQESDSAGNLVARYIHGPGIDAPVAAYRGSTSEFYETDALGSITSLSNTSGAVNQNYVYDSFGNVVSTTGTFIQPFRYTGREFDSETGLYFYRARYYDAQIGRFLSEDPLQFGGGVTFYSYTRNRPTTLVDPSGLLDVFVWPYTGKNGNWGHASLQLQNGTYISWWPSGDRHPSSASNDIYDAPALEPNYQRDKELEGSDPLVIHLDNLDEAAIQRWWDKFRSTHKWKTLSQNCSTTTAEALDAGGGTRRVPLRPSHIVWTPADVAEYASEIKAAGQGQYLPEWMSLIK